MTWQQYLADHQPEDDSDDEGPDESLLWWEWTELVTEEGDD